MEFYSKLFGNRLVKEISASEDNEETMIKKLKVIYLIEGFCGTINEFFLIQKSFYFRKIFIRAIFQFSLYMPHKFDFNQW